MLWHEVVRILKFGPSKRPATNSTYNRSNSHPSMTNLNESTSGNSLNRSNYASRQAIMMNANGSLNNSVGVYGNTPLVYETSPKNPIYNINSNGTT